MTSSSGDLGSLPDASSQPEGVAHVWNDRRQAIREWLESEAPALADLYSGVVQLLADPNFPGRVRFLAHGVREIANRLPDIVAGFERPPRFQWKNRLDAFAKIWERDGPGTSLAASENVDSTTEIHVSVRIVREIDVLVGDFTASRETAEAAATRLFEALAPENEAAPEDLRPVIRQWLKVTQWFVPVLHGAQRDEDEVIHMFGLFETGLASLIEAFYKPVDDLDDILEEANA